MELFASFSTTRYSLLKERWNGEKITNQSIRNHPAEDPNVSGGLVAKINWNSGLCVELEQYNQASGMVVYSDQLLIASGSNIFVSDHDLRQLKKFTHPLFNNLHGTDSDGIEIAVTSSGIDSVLFFNRNFELLDTWCAAHNGFPITPRGKTRTVNLTHNHSSIYYPTTEHTTHLNSVFLSSSDNAFYLTLFWQGIVLKVCRATGKHTVCARGLKFPHSIQKLRDKRWCVADTGNRRVVISENWESWEYIDIPTCEWVQDVTETPSGTLIVSDTNSNRLIEVNIKGKIIEEWIYNPNWKIYETKLVVENA